MGRLQTTLGLLLCTLCVAHSQHIPADGILAPYGPVQFSELYREALDVFLTTQEIYRKAEYARASELLKHFWERHPPGTREWADAMREADAVAETAGLNFGSPVCYYALRMLTDCVAWRVKAAALPPDTVRQVRLTVLLVGHSSGIEPSTLKELEDNTGEFVVRSLDPLLQANGHEIIHKSLWLFEEYVRAITGGKLKVETSIVSLTDLDIPVRTTAKPRPTTNLAPAAVQTVWNVVDDGVKARTDWWWILFPAHFPYKHPDFEKTEFAGEVSMWAGPDGFSPAFVAEDSWLVNKPRHLGKGRYTEEERMAYFPQWLQHEFFHHLFRAYLEFKLETKAHQWFDRGTWPSDFKGLIEPDYFTEALRRRLLPLGDPPLNIKLRYAPPPKELLQRITPAMLLGKYRRDPIENLWHEGSIAIDNRPAEPKKPAMRWTNYAGTSWGLELDSAKGSLLTGQDNPYYSQNPATGREFRIVLRRRSNGDYLPAVAGFVFNGEFYAKDRR
jgi:hypothetical protein